MFDGVWAKASVYAGCDQTWTPNDPGRRFVGDNRLVLRAIDLGAFNVFDFDAFGSPWEQMLILASRRRWKKGELGAVVLTDGSSLNIRWGAAPRAMAELSGIVGKNLPPKAATGDLVQRSALHGWCREARVTLRKMWRAEGNGSGNGGAVMVYTCIGFAGN